MVPEAVPHMWHFGAATWELAMLFCRFCAVEPMSAILMAVVLSVLDLLRERAWEALGELPSPFDVSGIDGSTDTVSLTSSGGQSQRAEGGSAVEALAEAIAEVEHCSLQLRLQEAAAQQCLIVEGIETQLRKVVAEVEDMKCAIEADLQQVVPSMERALEALDRLEYEDLSRTRALTQPPPAVALVFAAVCEALGAGPEKQTQEPRAVTSSDGTNADNQSPSTEPPALWSYEACMEYWPAAQKLLAVGLVIQQIHCFDKDKASQTTIDKLKPLSSHPDLAIDGPLQDSPTGSALALWLRALIAYHEVAQVVAPKKDRFQELTKLLESQEATLGEELRRLQELQAAAEDATSTARSVLLRQSLGVAAVKLPERGLSALATRGQAVRDALQLSEEL